MRPSHLTVPQNQIELEPLKWNERRFASGIISELVTVAGAGIGEALPRFWNELPVVAAGLEGELQDTESCGIANFAVADWRAKWAMVLAAGTNYEFANASRGISRAIGLLGSEPFVIMIMTADDHVGTGLIESLPESLHGQIVTMRATGTEQGLVPIGERTRGRMRGEIGAQPLFLRGAGVAAANVLAFAIQNDDVPGSELVAVVTGLGVTCSGTKIIEVRGGTGGMKFVIARSRPRAGFYAAPSLVVTLEIFLAAIRIGEVAGDHNSAGDLLEQFCGGFCAGKILAISDVAIADENGGVVAGRGRCSRFCMIVNRADKKASD